jgi:hypothetical protein
MIDDVELLYRSERFTSCTALVLAYVDALASPGADSDRGAFARYIAAHFPELSTGLGNRVPGKSGGDLLYDRFRNGLLHGLGPKDGFALCRDGELGGRYVDEVQVLGTGQFVGINVDRLVRDFLGIVRREQGAA